MHTTTRLLWTPSSTLGVLGLERPLQAQSWSDLLTSAILITDRLLTIDNILTSRTWEVSGIFVGTLKSLMKLLVLDASSWRIRQFSGAKHSYMNRDNLVSPEIETSVLDLTKTF